MEHQLRVALAAPLGRRTVVVVDAETGATLPSS
jgi:hypothetical protein